ncbi:unnamed protein product [Closterium sp. Yama58-4]|nr:unnamed protein product [Closterium sp. Yama58-4]
MTATASEVTWVVEVTKYKDVSKDALSVAMADLETEVSRGNGPITILLVHVMTEVPCSRGMDLPASEVDPKTALEHGRRLVEVMLRPLLAHAKTKKVHCNASIERNDRRELGLCAAARRAKAQRVYVGLRKKLLGWSASASAHYEAGLPPSCLLVVVQGAKQYQSLPGSGGEAPFFVVSPNAFIFCRYNAPAAPASAAPASATSGSATPDSEHLSAQHPNPHLNPPSVAVPGAPAMTAAAGMGMRAGEAGGAGHRASPSLSQVEGAHALLSPQHARSSSARFSPALAAVASASPGGLGGVRESWSQGASPMLARGGVGGAGLGPGMGAGAGGGARLAGTGSHSGGFPGVAVGGVEGAAAGACDAPPPLCAGACGGGGSCVEGGGKAVVVGAEQLRPGVIYSSVEGSAEAPGRPGSSSGSTAFPGDLNASALSSVQEDRLASLRAMMAVDASTGHSSLAASAFSSMEVPTLAADYCPPGVAAAAIADTLAMHHHHHAYHHSLLPSPAPPSLPAASPMDENDYQRSLSDAARHKPGLPPTRFTARDTASGMVGGGGLREAVREMEGNGGVDGGGGGGGGVGGGGGGGGGGGMRSLLADELALLDEEEEAGGGGDERWEGKAVSSNRAAEAGAEARGNENKSERFLSQQLRAQQLSGPQSALSADSPADAMHAGAGGAEAARPVAEMEPPEQVGGAPSNRFSSRFSSSRPAGPATVSSLLPPVAGGFSTGGASSAQNVGAHSMGQIDLRGLGAGGDGFDCRLFTPKQLEKATRGYARENLLGRGSFGYVFKGEMLGCKVAVKRLEGQGWQGPDEFRMEVEVLSRMRHPNIVLLMGCCVEEMALIYEFLSGGTLQDKLGPPKTPDAVPLSWVDRLRIFSEISSALLYLHQNEPPIVHRDLKPDNILLDAHMMSKIGDVGLARLLCADDVMTMKVRGTAGYIDPEEVETCEISVLSDIYALGLILLQLLTGQRSVKAVHRMLADCTARPARPAQPRAAAGAEVVLRYLDTAAGDWRLDLAEQVAALALRCAERRRERRPDLAEEIHPTLVRVAAEAGAEERRRKKRIDSQFICPISKEIMKDPVVAADGFTYERQHITAWMASSSLSPATGQPLPHTCLTPNNVLKNLIASHNNARPYHVSALGRTGIALPQISHLALSSSASPALPPTVSCIPPTHTPTLSLIVAHAFPHRRSRFPLPPLTLPPAFTHASPYRRERLPPPSCIAAHRPRFLPPSPTLPRTVAHAFPHRRPRFPSHRPPCRLEISLTADLPSLVPLSTSPSLPCLSRSPSSSPSLLHPHRPPSHPFLSYLGSSLLPFPFDSLYSYTTTLPPLSCANLLSLAPTSSLLRQPPLSCTNHARMAGAAAALEQSAGRTAGAARAGGQQGAQCCRGRGRGAGGGGARERGRLGRGAGEAGQGSGGGGAGERGRRGRGAGEAGQGSGGGRAGEPLRRGRVAGEAGHGSGGGGAGERGRRGLGREGAGILLSPVPP